MAKGLATVDPDMATAVDAFGLAALVLGNTAVAALLVRWFRVRMATAWAGPVYAVLVGAVVMLASTLLVGGFLRLGPNLGDASTVVAVTIVGPLSVGLAVDYFWMPAPEEVDLPDSLESR